MFPHSMSYFNELAGGPRNGHRYMVHATFGWSQDDFYLKRWLESHPEIDAPYLHLERSVSLERLGLGSRGEPSATNDPLLPDDLRTNTPKVSCLCKQWMQCWASNRLFS